MGKLTPYKAISKQWPIKKIEALLLLVFLGKSASQIAAQLDVTRDAVIGKCHKMNIRLGCIDCRRSAVRTCYHKGEYR